MGLYTWKYITAFIKQYFWKEVPHKEIYFRKRRCLSSDINSQYKGVYNAYEKIPMEDFWIWMHWNSNCATKQFDCPIRSHVLQCKKKKNVKKIKNKFKGL